MIYVSLSRFSSERADKAIVTLAEHGFLNIEMSSDTAYYDGFEADLSGLKKKYGLNLLCHNYFPPAAGDFVLNLASLDDKIYRTGIVQLKRTIDLCRKIGADKLGFHSGFLFDLSIQELGGEVALHELYPEEDAFSRFRSAFEELKGYGRDMTLYLENNVLTERTKRIYTRSPFMLTDLGSYNELRKIMDFKLLLDVGHLKVSAHSLGFDFPGQLAALLQETDYIHLSDNDGREDRHLALGAGSGLWDILNGCDLRDKTITLETNVDGIDELKRMRVALEELSR